MKTGKIKNGTNADPVTNYFAFSPRLDFQIYIKGELE